MHSSTRQRLLGISERFYSRHGAAFDASRTRPWPGWDRLWQLLAEDLPRTRPLRCLDAGCGNGRFGRFLHRRAGAGLRYVGIDLDPALLDAARRDLAGLDGVELHPLDLCRDGLADVVDTGSQDLVALFGVLHHVAGEDERRDLLRRLGTRAAPGGRLVASIWRLDRDPDRFCRLLVPWQEWSSARDGAQRIDTSDLEPGDVLLSWRGDRQVPRYCHFPTDQELERLADLGPGLALVDRFEADGPTGRDNLYLVWRRTAAC